MGQGQAGQVPGGKGAAAATGPRTERSGLGETAYRTLYLQCPDGVLFTVTNGRVIAANPAACEILRMSEEDICQRGRLGLADPSDARWAALLARREREGTVHGVARMLRGDGVAIEVEMSARVFDDGVGHRSCTVIRDVSDRVATERRLAEMAAGLRDLALLDDLTGLRNRRGFVEVAAHVIELADRQGMACHVLFVDVDNMKAVNDTLGHTAGDQALKAVATSLTRVLRRSDVLGRLGGDEFVALTVGFDDHHRSRLERRIRADLASAQTAAAVGAGVEVSLGWAAHLPRDSTTIEDLLLEADGMMYADKRRRGRTTTSGPDAPRP